MSRFIPVGAPISPSGQVRMGSCGRRGVIAYGRRGCCTWCGREVAPPRQTWCSDECVKAYKLTQPDVLRSMVVNGCACLTCGEPSSEMDHTQPIIEGGHPFDLANLRPLCTPCHARETAALASRRAAGRRLV